MAEKIKIMILQTRHIESISYLTAELIKSFPADRYEATLVYLEQGEPNGDDLLAHKCVFLGLTKRDYKGMRWKAKRALRPFLAANHFDVIIANMYKPVHLLMQLRHSVSAAVCIGIIHAFGEFDRLGRRWMMRFMLDHRWCMVGVSAAVKAYLINAGCGLHQHNTAVINNAVDVEFISRAAFDSGTARRELALPANGLIFGTVGRCVVGKRHLELVKAFHQFAGNQPDVYLVIIGDGDARSELCDYISAHQLKNVYLPGYVPQAMRYLRAMDIFVFPSESEGFGIALIEAMALGLPTIVNQVEPLSSIVGNCGIKTDTADINGLASAMKSCAEWNTSARQALGQAHLQRVRDFYDIATFRAAYRRLVEARLGDSH